MTIFEILAAGFIVGAPAVALAVWVGAVRKASGVLLAPEQANNRRVAATRKALAFRLAAARAANPDVGRFPDFGRRAAK